MPSLADIRAGLAGNLATLQGVQVSAYVLSNPTPPVVWVRPSPDTLVDYHQTMGAGVARWHFVVEAFVGTPSDIGAQKTLDELVESTGATSVKAAIEADKTLAGAAQDLECENAHGYASYETQAGSGVLLLGCKWNVTVLTTGG